MGGQAKSRNGISLQTGKISDSAIAVGDYAQAKVVARRAVLSRAQTDELVQLLDSLIDRLGRAEDAEVRADAEAVRAEIQRKKVNLSLVRPALKGIAAGLGSVQSLSDIAANVLTMVRHLA